MKSYLIYIAIARFLLFLLLICSAQVQAEFESQRKYGGNCIVATDRDDFTDELKGHRMLCIDLETRDHIVLRCGQFGGIWLSVGVHGSNKDKVHVRYRWGKNETQEGFWKNIGKYVINQDSQTLDNFAEAILTEQRLIYEVGNFKGVVRLDLMFQFQRNKGVRDFKARCSM